MICIKEKNKNPYLYQYDTGRDVIISYPKGCEIVSVEYFNDTTDVSPQGIIREENGMLLSEIPNSFLESDNKLHVYLTIHDDRGRQTVTHKDFTVIARPKPGDYVKEPDQVLSWHELDERIRNIEENGTGNGSNITVDDALNEESENPVQNKVVAKQFQDIDEKIGVINLHKVTTVATLSSGKSSAFVYQLDKRISGLFKVPNLPPMYWYIYDETGTRINYYSFGACPTKIDLKDNDTTVTAIVYFVTGRVIKVMYSIADNTFTTEVLEYSKYDIDQLINAKQNVTDKTLKTNDKTIVGAINEINGKIPTVQDVLNALPTWQGGAY